MHEKRRLRNEALARGSQAYKRGELGDDDLAKLLSELEDYVELENAVGDYYYLSRPKSEERKQKDPDKVFLVAEKRKHGMEQHPMTHKAITATQQLHERGAVPLVNAPDKGPAIERMRYLLDKYVMDTSVGQIGRRGQRHKRNAEQINDVAASLMVDMDRGYNSRAGYAYYGMPLDAGHLIGHASRPDLSDLGSNLEWENQYANKAKADAEKRAAQDGREATDEELAAGVLKSHLKKLTSDVVLPGNKGSKARQEFMSPINQKVDDYYDRENNRKAGDIFISESGPGDVIINK